ncbi:MAG: methyltransferase [Desulforhopalus sp.]
MSKEWDVGRLLGVSSGYWTGCAIQAGVRLDLFSTLGDQSRDAGEVGEMAGTDPRATGLLLDALTAVGLIHKKDDSYANTPFTAKFLVKDSPAYMGHIILHHHHILDGWAQLDEAVKTGTKVVRRQYGEEVERQSFLLGMYNLAMGLAPQIASIFDMSGRRRLLDLGGGPGTYAIHFCLANPELNAVILDRPTTESFARQTVAQFNLSNRIEFVSGDFTVDPLLGGPYDVAWLSHILHSNSYSECQHCIDKTIEVMEPGGMILIHDFILNDEKDGPDFAALFSLNMLVGTDNGRSYSRAEIIDMLTRAGADEIIHHSFRAPNHSSVISGVKR